MCIVLLCISGTKYVELILLQTESPLDLRRRTACYGTGALLALSDLITRPRMVYKPEVREQAGYLWWCRTKSTNQRRCTSKSKTLPDPVCVRHTHISGLCHLIVAVLLHTAANVLHVILKGNRNILYCTFMKLGGGRFKKWRPTVMQWHCITVGP